MTNSYNIPFNKPYVSSLGEKYILESLKQGKLSGDGNFTSKCHDFFNIKQSFQKVLLTTSCTSALEMAAILCDIKAGDEVIMPSYTFVSTANAFELREAKIVFADSRADHPGIDESQIESLITAKTKCIVPVHYAGVACNMDIIMQLAAKYKLFVIEDAAQAIDSYFGNKLLGGIGHFGTYSFHDTKNITSGEGGLLMINDNKYNQRAEVIREKGTNRSMFFRGEIDKYGWVDVGSSYLPSEINAALLYSQIQNLEYIQSQRKQIWNSYDTAFRGILDNKYGVKLPYIPEYATNNGHMYYLVCCNNERSKLINYLKSKSILACFHYQSLYQSEYFKDKYQGEELNNSNFYTSNLVRLPLFCGMNEAEQNYVIKEVLNFYSQ